MLEDCPLKIESHRAHDDKIRELISWKENIERTPRKLAEKIIELQEDLSDHEKMLGKANERVLELEAKLSNVRSRIQVHIEKSHTKKALPQ